MNFIKNKALIVFLLIVAVLYCYSEADGRGDFFIFLSAAGDLGSHVNVFEKTYVDGYHYYYSVLFALLLKPFVSFPFMILKCAWLLLNLCLFAWLIRLLMNSVPVKSLNDKQRMIFLACVLMFSLRFVRDNIHHSQITILILWCCIYGVYLIAKNKPVAGSLVLAIGINIKLLPIVLLPYLLYRGYFKAFALTIIFYLVFLFMPSLFIGHDYNMGLLKTWLNLIDPTNQKHVLDVEERTFHGLSTLLSTLLVKNVPDAYALPLKRNIADISLHSLSSILLITRLALVSFTLFFTGLKFFKPAGTMWQQYVELSYILLIIPLIFPHQQQYAFLFVVPAVTCICFYLLKGKMKKLPTRIIICLLALIFLTFDLKLILGGFNNYYDHFKILTYGAMLVIPLLAWIWKKSKKEEFLFFEQ